ncbi:MAG: LSU ribosomal protein L4P [Parcubacteria group bacterium Gr01-1014_72]|nr:MAG: LSU ribosomal protein L4P [Parcubacteria group bacterium Gr01-1014_72]
MEATIYNSLTGKEAGTITLPAGVFGARWNADLVHRAVTSLQSSRRRGTAHAKTRGEVSGGGRKPWRQKGTGRARHGSIRSPLWVGGGVTHGPRNDKVFERKVNKKERAAALRAVLSRKFKEGEVLFVDAITMPRAKTSDARKTLLRLGSIPGFSALAVRRKNAFILALPSRDEAVMRSFRNFSNALVEEVRNVNLLELLSHKFLLLANPLEAVALLEKRVS